MKDKYEEHASGFKNEADVEEEMDDEGLDAEEVKKKHFEEDEEK